MQRHEIVDLIERYSFKEIEEYCGMPKRTLKPNRKVPKKYWAKMQEMINESTVVPPRSVARGSMEPKATTKEVPKETIVYFPSKDSIANLKPTHEVVGREFCYIKPDGGHGKYIPKSGERYYKLPDLDLETANVNP